MPRKGKPAPLTAEEKTARLTAAHERMESEVAKITTSAAWQTYLATAAKFHNYSFGNVLLLWSQALDREIDLTSVAGFRRWAELGRKVRKGERGLQVLAPCVYRPKKGEDSGQENDDSGQETGQETGQDGQRPRVKGFTIAHVWDASQTNCAADDCRDPGNPDKPHPNDAPCPHPFDMGWQRSPMPEGAVPAGLLDNLHAYASAIGYPIDYGQANGGKGHTDHIRRHIVINPGRPEFDEVRTVLHELGHALLHNPDGERPADRSVRETEAESAAYLAATMLGLDYGAVNFEYVAGWAPDLDTVRTVGARVQGAAKAILAAVDDSGEETAEETVADVVATAATPARAKLDSDYMAAYYAERDRRRAQLEEMAHGYAGDKKHLIETGQWQPYTLAEHMRKWGGQVREMPSENGSVVAAETGQGLVVIAQSRHVNA